MNFPKEKRMKMNLTSTSKFVSLILRHKPETIGIQLDEHGWANVDELIAGISKTHGSFSIGTADGKYRNIKLDIHFSYQKMEYG